MTSLHLYLSYRDAAAALDWLARAFGFETTTRYDDAGAVAHAEARLGDAEGYEWTFGIHKPGEPAGDR